MRLHRLPLLIISLLAAGCFHGHQNPDAKAVGMHDSEYRQLTQKAYGGDKEAAETLAQLWYQYEFGSNEKALYWAQIAAQNGSKRAAAATQYAREHLSEN